MEEVVEEGIEFYGFYDCGFLDYVYYFNVQEDLEVFWLLNFVVNGEMVYIEMYYYFFGDGQFFLWDDYIYFCIELKKEEGSWKINWIEKVENC